MAVSYKGLTIQFGGETTALQSALRKVSSTAKDTTSALKDIDKALALDPGNVELLEQKTKLLSKAYDETEQKVDAYKAALAQLEAKQESGVELTEQEERQYASLKAQVAICEDQLDKYGKELKETQSEAEASKTSLYQLGQTLEDNADKLGSVGSKMETAGKATTTAFAGIATAAVAALDHVEEAVNIAVNSAGAVGDAADEIRRSVRDVAAEAPGDLETVGQAVGDVNTHFQVTGDRLDEVSSYFLEFAKITGGDVSTSIEDVAMAMKAFNVDSSETELVLDQIASTSTATGVSVDTLTSAVNDNGSTFREMGLSLQDSITLIGNFEAAGVPTTDMLTGLKKAAANCAQEGISMSDMLEQLVEDLQDPAKQAEATQTAFDLFGSKSATAFIDAAESGRINMSDLGGSLSDAEGFVSELCDETMSTSDQMEEALKDVTLAGAELGEQFAPVVEAAAEALKGFSEWVGSLTPEQKELFAGVVAGGIAFGGLTTAAGKVLQSAGTLGGTLKSLSGFMGTAKGAASTLGGGWKSLTGLISANPIGLGIAAVAAAVAGLTWFFTQTEEGQQLWADFTQFLQDAWQGVQDFFAGAGEFFGGVWDSVTSGAQGLVDDLGEGWADLTSDAAEAWESVSSDAAEKWDGMVSGAQECFGIIGETVGDDLEAAQSAGSSASSALSAALSGDWDSARENAADAFQTISSRIGERMENARENAIAAGDAIGEKLGFPGLGTKVAEVFETAKDNITKPISDAWNTISSIPGKIMDAFAGISINLPSIKLPHFSVSWNDLGVAGIKLPSIGVSWYAQGGIFDSASLIGVGEAGSEAVLPIDRLSDLMADALEQLGGVGGATQVVSVNVELNAQVADGLDAYETGQQIGVGIASKLKQRGVAIAT